MNSFKHVLIPIAFVAALLLVLPQAASALPFGGSSVDVNAHVGDINLFPLFNFTISPENHTAELGEVVDYQVLFNGQDVTSQFTWSINGSAAVASLVAPGTVSVHAQGQVKVRAYNASQNVTLETTLIVINGTVTKVEISPLLPITSACTLTQFNAAAYNSHGVQLPASFNWSAGNSTIVIINSTSANGSAVVQGNKAGITYVRATETVSGVYAQTNISVTPGAYASLDLVPDANETRAGIPLKLNARVYDACGNIALNVPSNSVTWSSTSSKANITANGSFSATVVNNYAVKAQYGGFTDTTSIAVVLGKLKVVSVTDSNGNTNFNATVDVAKPLTVVAEDVYGNKQTPFDDFWGAELAENAVISTETAGGSGRIDGSLNFYGQKNGNVKIKLEAEGLIAEAVATVIGSGTASSIQLTAPQTVITTGSGVQINATVLDAYGNAVPSQNSIDWSIYTGTGSVNSTGYFTSNVVGDCQVRAAIGSTYALITIRAGVGPADHLHPGIDSLEAGAGSYYKIKVGVVDHYDNSITNASSAQYNYSVENETGTAAVTSDGYFIGYKAGKVKLTATDKSNSALTGTLEITVAPGLPVIMEVHSENGMFKLREGDTLQLSIYAEDAYENVVDEQYLFNPRWQITSEGGEATIGSSGLVTAVKAGKIKVTVSLLYASKTATQEINVLARPNQTSAAFPAGTYGDKPRSSGASALISTMGGVAPQETQGGITAAAASTASGFFTLAGDNGAIMWLGLLIVFIAAVFIFVRSRIYSKAGEKQAQAPQGTTESKSLRQHLLG